MSWPHDAGSPIGVYDSGVGGISVLRALRAAMPEEAWVYVADSGHAPYGPRSRGFLQARAREVLGFFARRKVKAVVLACNTVSAAAAASLRAACSVPIVAMEPAIKPAAGLTRSGTVLVLATAFTVRSLAVARLCSRFGHEARILLRACPGLVEEVEAARFRSEATLDLLRAYVRPGVEAGADTIVLGCTHYAFLEEQIAQVAGQAVRIVEPSQAIARQLERTLQGHRAAPRDGAPPVFFTSGSVSQLRGFLEAVGENASSVEPL